MESEAPLVFSSPLAAVAGAVAFVFATQAAQLLRLLARPRTKNDADADSDRKLLYASLQDQIRAERERGDKFERQLEECLQDRLRFARMLRALEMELARVSPGFKLIDDGVWAVMDNKMQHGDDG